MSAVEFELRSQSLKRDRNEDDVLQSPHKVSCSSERPLQSPLLVPTAHTSELQLTPESSDYPDREASPARSSTSSLTDADTATPPAARNSPATVFSALNVAALPPKKRVRLTCVEKEEKRIMKEIKERERADEKSRKEAERREKEESKARRDAEREAERKRKDTEREEKRLMKEAEKAEKEKAREDERRRKEEERQRIEEEKRKKERSQPKLNAFFKIPGASVKSQDSDRSKSVDQAPAENLISRNSNLKPPGKNLTLSDYEKRFPPFFVQSNVTIAPINIFERHQGAITNLEKIIDSYICGEQTLPQRQSFDTAAFNIRDSGPNTRGWKCVPVSDIMARLLGGPHRPIDLTTDSQNMQIKRTRHLLKFVPYKVLSFVEDVRPPYKGTYTKWPKHGVKKLARNPFKRDLPKVDYDYDSEAEWVADEGEDLESDGEEDEDGADDEDDLKGFIDDEDDSTTNARKIVLQGDLEVQSTGLCFEDQNSRNPNPRMFEYRMEIIHGE
jgi:chromatin assembly factor 1 subunit A